MTKNAKILGVIVVIIVIGAIVWYATSRSASSVPGGTTDDTTGAAASTTAPVPTSESTKISDKTTEYQNDELGFSVKYPSTWEREESNAGVNFIMPIDKTQVSTIATLQSNIQVLAGTCAFPPVTTIKDRSTLASGSLTFNMISMSNVVQGRNYFNRMYSLQKGSICYMFSFASISLATSAKNLTGSQATQAENNNKAIVNSADAAFTDMIKSFAFVVGPQGIDETTAAPAKK